MQNKEGQHFKCEPGVGDATSEADRVIVFIVVTGSENPRQGANIRLRGVKCGPTNNVLLVANALGRVRYSRAVGVKTNGKESHQAHCQTTDEEGGPIARQVNLIGK